MSGGRLAILGARVFPMGPPGARGPARGADMDRLDALEDAAVLVEEGRIAAVVPRSDASRAFLAGAEVVEAGGAALMPGFVDPHTHLPFFGWRVDEYDARGRGDSYARQAAAQAARAGERPRARGIARSAELLRGAPDAAALAFSRRLVREMVAQGTTAMELKSGYGMTVDGELRQLRLARALAAAADGDGARAAWPSMFVTALFLHARPPAPEDARWPGTAAGPLLARALSEGRVDGVDAFVERIAFSADEARPFLLAARARGLFVRLHAEQLSASGGADLAVELGALSADHLEFLEGKPLRRLAASPVVATLLPGATHSLRADRVAPARDLIAAGAAVALATDLNPGTSPVASMAAAVSLAVSRLGMTAAEALTAATRNAACALGWGDRMGRIASGLRADMMLLDTDDPRAIPYRLGHNPVTAVWIGGLRAGGGPGSA